MDYFNCTWKTVSSCYVNVRWVWVCHKINFITSGSVRLTRVVSANDWNSSIWKSGTHKSTWRFNKSETKGERVIDLTLNWFCIPETTAEGPRANSMETSREELSLAGPQWTRRICQVSLPPLLSDTSWHLLSTPQSTPQFSCPASADVPSIELQESIEGSQNRKLRDVTSHVLIRYQLIIVINFIFISSIFVRLKITWNYFCIYVTFCTNV